MIAVLELRFRLEYTEGFRFATGHWIMDESASDEEVAQHAHDVRACVEEYVEKIMKSEGIEKIFVDEPSTFHLSGTLATIMRQKCGRHADDNPRRIELDDSSSLPWED